MVSWLQTLVAGLVAGAAIGLVGVAVQLAYRHGRRLDLVPLVTASAVALGAASGGATGQLGRLINGSVLVPLAALAGALVHVAVVDRPHHAAPAVGRVLVPVAVAVAGQAALTAWVGGRVFTAVRRASGVHLRGVLLVTWTEVGAACLAILAVAVVAVAADRGRTGLRLRAVEAEPELLALSGVDPARLGARLAARAAGAGGLGGLLLASIGPVPAPGLGDVGLRSAEALVVGGVRHPAAVLLGGVVIEATRALAERAAPGWGPAAGHGLTLAVLALRLARGPRLAADLSLRIGEPA
jgi:branched-chain amino acid transport system permease protein